MEVRWWNQIYHFLYLNDYSINIKKVKCSIYYYHALVEMHQCNISAPSSTFRSILLWFSPFWSRSVYLAYFGSFRSIQSSSVQFSLFWSGSVLFHPLRSFWSMLAHFSPLGLFCSFLSKSVQLGPSFVHFEFALEQIGFHVIIGFLSCNHRSLLYSFVTYFRFLIFWIMKKCYLIIMYIYYYIIAACSFGIISLLLYMCVSVSQIILNWEYKCYL